MPDPVELFLCKSLNKANDIFTNISSEIRELKSLNEEEINQFCETISSFSKRSAEQSNNLITQAVSQSSQDFAKLTETMQSVSDKLDVMIMVNTAQNRNQKQTVDAIKSSGNLFKGGV